jgi:hypothetical protein
MGKMGFFQWVREGVRRSVLLGFSDAVEELGTAPDGPELHPHLAAVLHQRAERALEPPAAGRGSRVERKRLGRSLEQIQQLAAHPQPAASPAD